MQKLYLISYDITETDNYFELIEEIKKSEGWWHYLERTWIIKTKESADEIWERLENKINKKNNLLIAELGSDLQGWIPRKGWEWLNNNIDNLEIKEEK